MFRDELDVLQMRLEAMDGWAVTHVLAEAPVTFLGVAKPAWYLRNRYRYLEWGRKIRRVEAATGLPEVPGEGMEAARFREHMQRQVAWAVVDERADDSDIVLICDVDEIPSRAVLEWDGPDVAAVDMRTCIYAVDWECCGPLPPTCVVARAGYLRKRLRLFGHGLGDVRDGRAGYPLIPDGGWHLSWLGGPEAQAEKLLTASFHRDDILASPEGASILDGRRYREGAVAGGLPVKPVDVDSSWPAYVAERRCPANWFRPRQESHVAE